jgi:hypothetical protein
MLGASALSEYSIADQGIVLAGVSEMSGIASAANAGVGIMSGVASLDGNFTQTSTAIYISAGANSDVDFNFTETSAANVVKEDSADIQSAFTKTTNGIMIGSGIATKDLNFTQGTFGELLFEDINAGASPENYVTITPSGTESWTQATPSGSDTWTEIEVE